MPAVQAVHRSQIALAAKGNGPAQRAVLRIVQAIEKEGHDLNMELLQAAIQYKAMADREAERRRRLGITYVDPNAPHPDDLVIECTLATLLCVTRISRHSSGHAPDCCDQRVLRRPFQPQHPIFICQ